MKSVQRVVTSEAHVPEGYVRELKLSAAARVPISKHDPELANEVRLYEAALTMAREGRFPSFKLMQTPRSIRGPVFVPANWRQLVMAELATSRRGGAVKHPEVRAMRAMAMSKQPPKPSSASMEATPTTTAVVAPAEPRPEKTGLQNIQELRDLTEQNLNLQQQIVQQNAEMLTTMRALLSVWSPAATHP